MDELDALRYAAESRAILAHAGRDDLAEQAWNALCPQGVPIRVRHDALVSAGYPFKSRRDEIIEPTPARVFTWDYREQPPLGEILAKAREMAAPWFWFCPETGTQEHALILSARELSADEAERILWASVEG